MKKYEKPLAIINKFEVEDVIAVSGGAGAVEPGNPGVLKGDPGNYTVTFRW